MKAIEFSSVVGADRVLTIPSSLASNFPTGQTVRVLVMLADDDAQWQSATAREFGLGYADSDAIYDHLSAG